MQIPEVSFRGASKQDLSVGGSAFASSEYSGGWVAGNAFDKVVGTAWCTVSGQFPGWIAYDHVVPVDVHAVSVTWDGYSSYLPRSETDVTIAHSDDGVAWSEPVLLVLVDGALQAGATALFTPIVARPLIFIDAPVVAHVQSGVYTGPYGHAVTTQAPTNQGSYSVGLLGAGVGVVRGVVETKGTHGNTPLRARVRLLRERDGMVYRETWSDANTGAYRFDNVDELEIYTVLSYHPARDRRAVVADGLMPEVLP